jgi:hypothetical protein
MPTTFVLGPGLAQAMTDDSTTPASDEIFVHGNRSEAQWSEAMASNGKIYRWVRATNATYRFTSRSAAALPNEPPNRAFTFDEVWPHLRTAGATHGADAQVLTAITYQESGFTNWLVHADGTGHGLIGLDDHGLLPDFETWSGFAVGRGHSARSIPPELQLNYLAKTIAAMARNHGGSFLAACREWHRGPTLMNDALGFHYQDLIEAHISRLFS